MVTYKAIAEFFEDLVLNEGRTDVQAHVGFANINGQTIQEIATDYFGGGVVMRSFTDVDEFERFIYVYEGDEYEQFAEKHFTFQSGSFFVVKDVEGQKGFCWAIEA